MIHGAIAKLLVQKASALVLEQISVGKLKAFGSTLLDPTTQRTVGYLQARDTAGAAADTAKVLASLVGLANPATAPAAVAYAGGKTLFAIFDTQRTAHRIEDAVSRLAGDVKRVEEKLDAAGQDIRDVKSISSANLGLQFLDIGISVAGFASLEAKVADISSRITTFDEAFRDFQEGQLKLAFTELRSLSRAMDEGWRLTGTAATNRWHEVATRALSLQDQFETRSRDSLGGEGRKYLQTDAMIDAVAFANGLRVASLAACNETVAAQEAAADGARSLDNLTGRIGLTDIILPYLADTGIQRGTQDWNIALSALSQELIPMVGKIRQREANTMTRAAPFGSLEVRGIRPRDWLEQVREERDTALVYLPAD